MTQARRALLIGIEDYPLLPKLHGCVNDVTLMKEILQENFGFPEGNITLLTNEKATRQAILDAFDAMIAATGQDDIVVLHYAGHGGRLTDLEGDEPSGMDSTIQPYDTEGYTAGNQGKCLDITDDELALKLDALGDRTRFITLIMDCCHSGTITRDALGERGRSTPPDRRTPEQLAAVGRFPLPAAAGRGGPTPSGPSGWLPITEKYVVISGCRDEEIAWEYRPPEAQGAVTHGALSWFLSDELRQARPGTTYRDVFERAAARVYANNAAQRPQMEGKADREIFGVKDVVPTRYLKVTARNGDLITLSAGAAQGVTVGSLYAIHPQGTKDAKESTPLGEAEVVSLGVVTSEARVTESISGAVVPDSRAFETRHAFGEFRLAVAIVDTGASEAAPLVTLVEASPLLKMAEAGEPAAITLRLLPVRETVSPSDPIPRAGPLAVPMWAATAESGDLAMKLKPRGDEATVRDNLETIARYRQALSLTNPDPGSTLHGKFSLELLKRDSDGKWFEARPDIAGGEIVYTEGEPIGFRITSTHDQDTYVALVDFEANGAVTPLRPDRNSPAAQEKLRGGQSYDIGPMARPVPTVTWPAGYPYVDTVDHALEAEAVETIKLFVTEQPADFSVLTQKGVRSGGVRKSSPLGDLLNRAFQGSTTRGIALAPETPEGWTTVARSFVVRRRTSAALKPDGGEVAVGNARIVATAVSGTVTAHLGARARNEAAEALSGPLAEALAEAGAEVKQSVSVSGSADAAAPARGAGGAPGVELKLADPGPGLGQLVLSTDDLGVVSWHFAPPPEPMPGSRGSVTPEGGTRSYRIPTDLPSAESGAAGRGSGLADFGNKVLKEIVFPLMDPVLGKVSNTLVGMLEQRRFPYRIRPVAPENFAASDAPPMDGEAWDRLSRGRGLLLLHGAMSRSHMGFAGLPVDYVQELHRRYEGRIIGFDHITLSHDPKENARRFLEALPEGTSLDLDIISHARGGLVSRVLVEKQEELAVPGRRVRVGKCILVGVPNGGTPLADPASLGRMLDIVTNILTFIPVPYATEVLRLLMAVLKQGAVGALTGLDGLTAMSVRGKLLPWLNASSGRNSDTRYFAVAGDATPSQPGLRRLILGRGVGKLLGGPNDFLVPVPSVSGVNGSGYFPIEDTLELKGAEGVSSTRYFEHEAARTKILEWLKA